MERQRRYPSDLTDARWEIVEPMLPLIKSPGRIPKHPRRAIVDAILVRGAQRLLVAAAAGRLPALADGVLAVPAVGETPVTERILEELREQVRIAEGRGPEPSAGIIDSQSV